MVLKESEIDKICKLGCGDNTVLEIMMQTGHFPPTIRRYLKQNNISIPRGVSKNKINKVYDIYSKTHDANDVCEQTGYNIATVYKYLKLHGVKLRQGKRNIGDDEIRRIIYLYTHGNTKDCIARTARKAKRCQSTVRKYITLWIEGRLKLEDIQK